MFIPSSGAGKEENWDDVVSSNPPPQVPKSRQWLTIDAWRPSLRSIRGLAASGGV